MRIVNWYKFDDTAGLKDIISSNDVSWTGTPTYNTGKFGNGIYSNSTSNYVSGSETVFNPCEHIIEMWVKTDWSITNGVPSDGQRHTYIHWVYDANNYILLNSLEGALATRWNIRIGGTFYVYTITTGLTWSASTNTHLAWVFNCNGINGTSDIRRLYLNGSLVASDTTAIPTQTNTGGIYYNLVASFPAIDRVFDGVIDNQKIWNSTDSNTLNFVLANRETEAVKRNFIGAI
jgi:hypothetical protein